MVSRLGFVGTGAITTAVVSGLCTAGWGEAITVSPRNAERAAGLAARFPQVRVGADNQAVVDASDWVFLAVRPPDARDVLSALRFRAGQRIVSFVALVSADEITALTVPAGPVVRAVPTPAVARGRGPIAICPPDAEVEALLAPLGTTVAVDEARHLDALWSVTALLAPSLALLERTSRWLCEHGVPAETADGYVASLFHALSATALEERAKGFAALAAEHQTRGGLNEQALAALSAAGWYDQVERALDLVLARLEGRATCGPERPVP